MTRYPRPLKRNTFTPGGLAFMRLLSRELHAARLFVGHDRAGCRMEPAYALWLAVHAEEVFWAEVNFPARTLT